MQALVCICFQVSGLKEHHARRVRPQGSLHPMDEEDLQEEELAQDALASEVLPKLRRLTNKTAESAHANRISIACESLGWYACACAHVYKYMFVNVSYTLACTTPTRAPHGLPHVGHCLYMHWRTRLRPCVCHHVTSTRYFVRCVIHRVVPTVYTLVTLSLGACTCM